MFTIAWRISSHLVLFIQLKSIQHSIRVISSIMQLVQRNEHSGQRSCSILTHCIFSNRPFLALSRLLALFGRSPTMEKDCSVLGLVAFPL
ncbi:hypothetical protein DFO54_11775 [Erwinia sp. AG740]|nr:hypothetical protein DFO54_11775 [Erwinia sp. AG740]